MLKPITGTAFTGGVDESGKVNKISEEIIKKKVEIAFYSNCQTLVVPKDDEPFALHKLSELKFDKLNNHYPKRNLTIIGVKDINEILLRRDLVEIKKQKLIVRTGKFVKKNWVSAVVTVLLAILFAYLFVMDFDDNPAFVSLNEQLLSIKNKNGKVLWTKRMAIDLTNKSIAKMLYKFEDLDNDKNNELILCSELKQFDLIDMHPGRVICYDYKGEQLWEYEFKDSIFSKGTWQPLIYSVFLIDIINEQNKKVSYAIALNANFVSALFRLNAATGERLEGTLWNAGHFQDGVIGDFNRDGQKEIVLIAISNGFEKTFIVSINLDKINGYLPTSDIYKFQEIQLAEYNKFVLLPVTDYAKYLGARFNRR